MALLMMSVLIIVEPMIETFGFVATDVARLLRKRFDAAARDMGVTGPQWRMLLLIARNPGIRQAGLAEMLDVEPITTCRMVDRLEQAELVERRRDPEDRRAWQLFLTSTATPLIEALQDCGALLVDRALRDLHDDEKTILMGLMTRVRDNLGDDPVVSQRSGSHG